MKIELKINNKSFKDTKGINVLYTLLCLVRVLMVVTFCVIPATVSIPIFLILGTKKPVDNWIELFSKLAFNE